MRWAPLIVVGVASLACSGEQFAKLAFDANVQQGEGASLPADFPLSAPEGGTLNTVMDADLLGQHTITAVFDLPAGEDAAARVEAAAVEMEARGMDVTRSEGAATGVKGTERFVVSIGDQDGKPNVSMIVVR